MNLRVFKKDIEYFVAEFIDDCALFVALNPHKDSDEIAQIIDEAVELYNENYKETDHITVPVTADRDMIREVLAK